MEEIIDNVVITRKNRVPSVIIAIFSFLISLAISYYCFYLSSLGNYWFIALGILFIFESASLIGPLFKKDDYEAMRLQGAFLLCPRHQIC